MRQIFTLLLAGCCSLYSLSQDLETNLKKLKNDQEAVKELTGKSVKIGLSASIRTGFPHEDNSRAIAFITPTDNTVAIDHLDRMSYVISTSVTYFPKRKNKETNTTPSPAASSSSGTQRKNDKVYIKPESTNDKKNLKIQVGPTLNINLAEMGNGLQNGVFNKQVDGGIGLAFKFWDSEEVTLAITYERIAIRRPTNFILENEGNVLTDSNGDIITSINENDNRYYINSGMNGVAFKIVINLN